MFTWQAFLVCSDYNVSDNSANNSHSFTCNGVWRPCFQMHYRTPSSSDILLH